MESSIPGKRIRRFFAVLSQGLKPYSKSITSKLKIYSKKILASGKAVQYRIIDIFIDEVFKDQTLQQRYEAINNSIQLTGKRIIVMVDDLDRMPGFEVMQVLRVIRNSANFANTFFIVTLDHEYIINVLKKTDQFAKEEQYLKKIFQLTITLPQIIKETFSAELLKMLIGDGTAPEDKAKIEKAVAALKYHRSPEDWLGTPSAKEEGSLELMLSNYRDLKRFCNSFKISFEILKHEVDITDLFLLELIKAHSFGVFELIANKTLLERSEKEPYNYILNKAGWTFFKEKSEIDTLALAEIERVLQNLLRSSKSKSTREFSQPHNFFLYFCYQLFSLISLREFNEAKDLRPEQMLNVFNKWIAENKLGDLDRILNNYEVYRDKEEFDRFLRTFLLAVDNKGFLARARQMILNIRDNIKYYFDGEKDYISYVREMLNEASLPIVHRANIASDLLKPSIRNRADLLLPKKELQDLIFNLFDQYLQRKRGYDEEVFDFYLLNDDNREDSRIILNPIAHRRLFQFLSIDENFEGYLRYLIRSYSLPNNGEFAFAPFTKDIFDDWDTFKAKVQTYIAQDPQLKLVQPIILRHIDDYKAGKDRFILEGEDLKLVLDHLRSTGQYRYPD